MGRYLENFEPIRLVWLLTALAVAASIIIPTGYLLVTALSTADGFGFDAFAREFARRGTMTAMINTLVYVTGVAVLSVVIGVPMAFLTERTDISQLAKSIIRLSVICSVITPGFLTTMAYITHLTAWTTNGRCRKTGSRMPQCTFPRWRPRRRALRARDETQRLFLARRLWAYFRAGRAVGRAGWRVTVVKLGGQLGALLPDMLRAQHPTIL